MRSRITKHGRQQLTSADGRVAYTLFVIDEDPTAAKAFRQAKVQNRHSVDAADTSHIPAEQLAELHTALAAYHAEGGSAGPEVRKQRVDGDAIEEALKLLAQGVPTVLPAEAAEAPAALRAYKELNARHWQERYELRPEVSALARLWLGTMPASTDYETRADQATIVRGYVDGDTSHPLAAILDDLFAAEVEQETAAHNAKQRAPYLTWLEKTTEQITRYEADSPRKAATRYRNHCRKEFHAMWNGKAAITPKKGKPRTDQHGQPFGLGDWVQWTPEGFQAPVVGQVWSGAPKRHDDSGKSVSAWFVVTDRSTTTGEFHVMIRHGAAATGYRYRIGKSLVTSLGTDAAPAEQLPFEMLAEIPGAQVPDRPQAGSPAAAKVREQAVKVAAETGESVPRGPKIESKRRTGPYGGPLPEWDVKVDGNDYSLEWIREDEEFIVRTGKLADGEERIIGYVDAVAPGRAMCVRHRLDDHHGQLSSLKSADGRHHLGWRLDLDDSKYVITTRAAGAYEVTYADELIASVPSLRTAHDAAVRYHQGRTAQEAPAAEQPAPRVDELFRPGDFVWVEAEHDKQTPFVGDVVAYTRNGCYRVRELAHGTTCDYPATRLRIASVEARETDKARQEAVRDARAAEKEAQAAKMRADREAYEAKRDAEAAAQQQAAAEGEPAPIVAEFVDGREWGIGVRLAGTVKLTPVKFANGDPVLLMVSITDAVVVEALAGLGYELAESWDAHRRVIVSGTGGNAWALRVNVAPLAVAEQPAPVDERSSLVLAS